MWSLREIEQGTAAMRPLVNYLVLEDSAVVFTPLAL
jgi:hypothetical protein